MGSVDGDWNMKGKKQDVERLQTLLQWKERGGAQIDVTRTGTRFHGPDLKKEQYDAEEMGHIPR